MRRRVEGGEGGLHLWSSVVLQSCVLIGAGLNALNATDDIRMVELMRKGFRV